MGEHKPLSGSLFPIPGYEGVYYITPNGEVVNKHNVVLKPFPTKRGAAVELRHKGQRERVLISELLQRLENRNDRIRAD